MTWQHQSKDLQPMVFEFGSTEVQKEPGKTRMRMRIGQDDKVVETQLSRPSVESPASSCMCRTGFAEWRRFDSSLGTAK